MEQNIKFARNLVKGKIAETIFAQMYRQTERYTVLEFGYEKVIPELVQSGYDPNNGMVETLRTAPDFAVIDLAKKHVKLIEVKYRQKLDQADILRCAKRMHKSWNPSYLFIATLDGFYFDEITNTIANDGNMNSLDHEHVSAEIQDEYLKILQDFESKGTDGLTEV